MLSRGNSDPRVCAMNLLRTIRGEVPLVRTKGIAREHIDKPITRSAELRADAEWVLQTYEPRLSGEEVSVLADDAGHGNYDLLATVQ